MHVYGDEVESSSIKALGDRCVFPITGTIENDLVFRFGCHAAVQPLRHAVRSIEQARAAPCHLIENPVATVGPFGQAIAVPRSGWP